MIGSLAAMDGPDFAKNKYLSCFNSSQVERYEIQFA